MSHKPSSGLRISDLKQYIVDRLDIPRFYQKFCTESAEALARLDGADGWSERALCPIHKDKNKPQFFINHRDGHYHCHACGAHGSVFDFWMVMNGMQPDPGNKQGFMQALVAVANDAGVDISEYNKGNYQPSNLPPQVTRGSAAAVEAANNIPKKSTTEQHDSNPKNKPLSQEHYMAFTRKLEPQHFRYLAEKRGLTLDTIKEYCIGWNPDALYKDSTTKRFSSGRYTIPVFDKDGNCRNLRQYNWKADAESKMINYVLDKGTDTERRFGKPARLFNVEKLYRGNYEHAIICEGEWDCMLLNQKLKEGGYQTWIAVTGTAGANTFRPEWVDAMKGMNVYFCYDCDAPGKVAATDNATKFLLKPLQDGFISNLRIIDLPLEGTKDMKDISDYFLKAEYDIERFVAMCLVAPEIIPGGIAEDDVSVEAIAVDSLDDVLRERKYIDRKVTVPICIVSAAERIYHAIRSYKVIDCPLMANQECCSAESGERKIPYGHSMFIESCMEKEERVFNRLRALACHNDQKCRIEATHKVVMEEYLAHQVVERKHIGVTDDTVSSVIGENNAELTHVGVYFLQPEQRVHIEPKNYKATGWIRTHPRTSVATLFIETLTPMEDDYRKFTIDNPEWRQAIKTIKEEFTTEDIMSDITNGVTHIFHSDDILYAVLLTTLSVQYFNFNGGIQRGWVNSLIVGDSGVGKSATYTRFSDWVEVGQWFSCLSGTRTGLVYAQKQKDGEWYTTAGDYPKASGKLIGIDEVQVLEKEDTRTVANAIDRGILDVKRASSATYTARVRAVWMLNPKDERNRIATISDFPYGCECLFHIFDPMFVRRMDIACFRSRREEFDYNKYLGTSEEKPQIRLTPFLMRALIYWAWTREPKHIIFGEEATKHCLRKASELSAAFGDADKVPLVSPNDFRENLARLTVAFAILDRSFTDDLEHVVIQPDHVDVVAGLIDYLYSSPDCNLRELSRQLGKLNRLTDFKGVREYLDTLIKDDMGRDNPFYRDTYPTLRMILLFQQVGRLAIHEAPMVLGATQDWVRKRCTQLQSLNLLRPGERNTYQPTRKFNLFMLEWRKDQEIDRLLDTVQQQAAAFASRRESTPLDEERNFTGESYNSRKPPF